MDNWRKEWEKLKCNATQCGTMIGFEGEKDIRFIEDLLESQRKKIIAMIEKCPIQKYVKDNPEYDEAGMSPRGNAEIIEETDYWQEEILRKLNRNYE